MGPGPGQRRDGRRELEDLEVVFKALAHPTRRHVLLVLHWRGGSMGAGEIAGRFACTWPTTSRHLKVLEEAGLVRSVARGRERVYELRADRLRGVVGGWLDWFDVPAALPPGQKAEPASGASSGDPEAGARR